VVCLCHDSPLQPRRPKPGCSRSSELSCNTCHDEQSRWTRASLLACHRANAPGADDQDLVRLCAMCHSNSAIRARFNMPRTPPSATSQLHRQGHAAGSQENRQLPEFHDGLVRNVHQILPHADATSPAQRRQSARPPAASPPATAGPAHDLSSRRGPSRFKAAAAASMSSFACLFVLLIVFTFGPFFVAHGTQNCWKSSPGRKDPPMSTQHIELAKNCSPTRGPVHSWTVSPATQRFQHWVLATCFIILVLTGLPR